jgi:hypothetical protein
MDRPSKQEIDDLRKQALTDATKGKTRGIFI